MKPNNLQAMAAVDEAAKTAELDPFDLANLRLDQAFTETVGVRKLRTKVPVHKPDPQAFVRVHPAPEYRDVFPVVELKAEREEFIVTAALVPELMGEFVIKTLYLAIDRQANLFFWPTRLPTSDGRDNDWWRTQREAAELAMNRWIRIRSGSGAYDIYEALGILTEPEWPQESYWDLIRIGFRDHLIDRIDHPVIKRLRGQS